MNIAIFGAGSTGCYLAAKLILANLNVTLICRERIKQAVIKNSGIRITDYKGDEQLAMPTNMVTNVDELEKDNHFAIIFINLKGLHLEGAIDDIIQITNSNTHLVFMQNGLGSLELIRKKLDSVKYCLGITPFNVLHKKDATFHKGTEGSFTFAKNSATEKIKQALIAIGEDCDLYEDMQPVVYGKLLLNLNNGLNAISDLPIKQQLENRTLRKLLAGAMKEWLIIAETIGVELAQFMAVKPTLLPNILSLPNWMFKIVAKKMLDIDPHARSSMWEDIQAGRKTEVDFLNGAVVELAKKYDLKAPLNSAIVRSVKKLESGQKVKIEDVLEELKEKHK